MIVQARKEYIVVTEKNVPMKTRDGITLFADVVRPDMVGRFPVLLSRTPYGKRGFFYEAWTSRMEEWERISVPATECARIPKEFLEEERRVLGDWWFQQEYMCEFVDTDEGRLFDRVLVTAALSYEIEPRCSSRVLA